MLPTFLLPSTRGFIWVTGVASVKPKPSTITAPVLFSKSLITSRGRGELPEKQPLIQVISALAISGSLSIPIIIVGTNATIVGLNLFMDSIKGFG